MRCLGIPLYSLENSRLCKKKSQTGFCIHHVSQNPENAKSHDIIHLKAFLIIFKHHILCDDVLEVIHKHYTKLWFENFINIRQRYITLGCLHNRLIYYDSLHIWKRFYEYLNRNKSYLLQKHPHLMEYTKKLLDQSSRSPRYTEILQIKDQAFKL